MKNVKTKNELLNIFRFLLLTGFSIQIASPKKKKQKQKLRCCSKARSREAQMPEIVGHVLCELCAFLFL